MNKLHSFICSIFLALLCCCCPARSPAAAANAQELTVGLMRGNLRYCAAVWIGSDRLLTAAHCVRNAGQDPIDAFLNPMQWDPVGKQVDYQTFEDYRTNVQAYRHSRVLSYDPKDDLALLSTTSEVFLHPVAHVRRDPVWPGEEVHVVGHPLGELGWTYTHGYVATLRIGMEYEDREVNRLQLTVDVHPGNSGGGAFDKDGYLIGICSFHFRDMSDLSFFVGQDLIRQFLEAAPSN